MVSAPHKIGALGALLGTGGTKISEAEAQAPGAPSPVADMEADESRHM